MHSLDLKTTQFVCRAVQSSGCPARSTACKDDKEVQLGTSLAISNLAGAADVKLFTYVQKGAHAHHVQVHVHVMSMSMSCVGSGSRSTAELVRVVYAALLSTVVCTVACRVPRSERLPLSTLWLPSLSAET